MKGKKGLKYLFLICFVCLSLVSCASSNGHLPSHAFKNPAEGISIPHPVEYERQNRKTMTMFAIIMDPGLWTEVVAGGGVWPIVGGVYEGDNENLYRGYCYLARPNYWGDFLLNCVFNHDQSNLANARFLMFNRDAGWAYSLSGELQNPYDPQKFDKSRKYRKEIFEEYGWSLSELDNSWKRYYQSHEEDFENHLSVVEVSSSEDWDMAVSLLGQDMPNSLKMPDGEIRMTYLPLDNFRYEAVKNPGFTGGQRFLKNAKLPLIALPFAGAAMPLILGADVVSTALVAGIDDDWAGYYGRAKTIRYDLAPVFRNLCGIYKMMLADRNREIERLKIQIIERRK